MENGPIFQPSDRPWIGLVFVRPKNDLTARWHDAAQQLLDLSFRRSGIGSTELGLELEASLFLCRPHRSAPAEFRIIESVDKERLPHDQVQVHRPVLAVFEGAEAIEHDRLTRAACRPQLFIPQQAVPSQPIAEPSDGRVRDTEFSRNLSEPGTGDKTMKRRRKEPRTSKPIVDGEGLSTEVTPAMRTAVPLDLLGDLVAEEEPLLHVAPSTWISSRFTSSIGAEGRSAEMSMDRHEP